MTHGHTGGRSGGGCAGGGQPLRRKYAADYERRILKERLHDSGSGGTLVRRKGLSSVHLFLRAPHGVAPRARTRRTGRSGCEKRRPQADPVDPRDRKIAELERAAAGRNDRAGGTAEALG
jgi:hypothetical protein